MVEKQKAYAYMRVSTDRQVDGASKETQQNAIKSYAKSHNLEIVGWYWEPGISAKTANRPVLQQMLSDIKSKKDGVDVVAVYNLSRISRNLQSFSADIAQVLVKNGVELRSTQEEINDTPEGKLMMNISLSIHQYDNDLKSRLVKDNMATVAKNGWWQSVAPLGYKCERIKIGEKDSNGKQKTHTTLVIDNEQDKANKVQKILKRFSVGDVSVMDMVRLADKLGLRTRSGNKIKLTSMQVILGNPAYAGYNQSKMTGSELVKGRWKALIALEEHERIVSLLSHCRAHPNPYRRDNPDYPLKKTLICPHDGYFIRGSAPRTGAGGKSPRYSCSECNGGGSLSTEKAHELFIGLLEMITPNEPTLKLLSVILRRTVKDVIRNTKLELNAKNTRLEELDREWEDILMAVAKGGISVEEKEILKQKNDRERDELLQEIEELNERGGLSENGILRIIEVMKNPALLWKNGNLPLRQLLQELLFPNGLEIYLKDQKFGTIKLSPLYSVIPSKKASFDALNYTMVRQVESNWNLIYKELNRWADALEKSPLTKAIPYCS